METPKEWPQNIARSYDPIRVLGTGGFACVVLARKRADEQLSSDGNNDSSCSCSSSNSSAVASRQKVAIKVVGCNDGSENHDAAFLYARREIELLQQIQHAGVVRLFHSWENRNHQRDDEKETNFKGHRQHLPSPTAGVLVLEYLKGPTVESLLNHGGALSSTFGRLVIAQVMDAVAYLHYRAVLHRDIKPDNIIVTGALSSDSFIWDNDIAENGEDASTPMDRDSKPSDEWKRLCLKYRTKIIDFGFARALTPEDMEKPPNESSRSESPSRRHLENKRVGYNNIGTNTNDSSIKAQKKKAGGRSGGILRRLFSENSLSALDDSIRSNGSVSSVSHKMIRVMSTLGNRNYAAPEITERVRHITPQEKKNEKQRNDQKRASETTKTISKYVANYGVLADSYSMGHTIRYMMTGVKPGDSVEDTLRKQKRSGMTKKVLTRLGLKKKGKKTFEQRDKEKPRKPFYRSLDDVPGMILVLVGDLTELSVHRRVSIRKARRYAWISDVLAFQDESIHQPKDCRDGSSSEETANERNPESAIAKAFRLPAPSLEHASEEQLHELHETRYLPLATATPSSVVSTQTEKTYNSMNNLSLDSSSEMRINPAAADDFLARGLDDGGITF